MGQWTDAGGQVTYAARYAPFGALLWQQGTAPGPWGFAGEMQDPTGLIYLRARWYDPVTGRFLTRDPFPGLPVQPTTLHPYTYALNNPVLYVDPTGEFLFLPLLAVAAAGGFLGGLGYYGIQAYLQADPCTGMQWDWRQALFWGGVGTVMGTGIGVGIYGGWWVGVQAGWWGTTIGTTSTTAAMYACADGDCTNEIGYGIKLSEHALQRMAERGVSIEQVQRVILQNEPFSYYHEGVWKIGYYDPISRVFVGRVGDIITTVIANVRPQYIENLKVATP